MNPVRAGVVNLSEGHYFSICRAKIGLREIKWLDYDPVYLVRRRREKREEGKKDTKDGFMIVFRKTNGNNLKNWAYGNNRFKKEMKNVLGRRFEIKKVGKRSKMWTRPNTVRYINC